MKKYFTIFFLIVLSLRTFAQEMDITPYLQQIEEGKAASVVKILPSLKKAHPNDPSVLFLDAVLTTNGEKAFRKYYKIYTKYPRSNYADASLYRIFSFYFSMGLYVKAKDYLNKLKKEYPRSPYIKYADRNIPEEELGKVVLLGNKNKNNIKNKTSVAKSPIQKSAEINKDYFTVQAGAFLNYNNAKRLRRKFTAKNWTSRIYPKEVGGALLNVVTVGKFKNRKEAEGFLKILKEKFGIKGRIIKNKNQ